jgi:sterol desaturase/sphingolipid hydroxylase (fatty acid hydroxylase superfamily)
MLAHAPVLRLGIFALVFALLALAESLAPFRPAPGRALRWTRHLALLAIGSGLLRVVLPWLAVGAGAFVDELGYGVLQVLQLPRWLLIVVGVVTLDLAIYAQHRLFHASPLLWRLHRMHHSDTAFEISTGIRFHPLEIVLSMLIKIGIVVMLGIPALAVLLFEIALNAASLFSHTNVTLPPGIEHALRRVLVTPDMHRIHHSPVRVETNSNFGFCLSLWDRLFGSYRAAPERDPRTMAIGLESFREPREQGLGQLLVQPLRQEK